MLQRCEAHRRQRVAQVGMLLAGLFVTSPVHSAVYLNEIQVRDPEAVELYNRGPASVDLSGWRIVGSDGEFVIPAGTTLGPLAYIVFIPVYSIFADIGGETSVMDVTALNPIDRVSYGAAGSAPLPPIGGTLVRAPDAADAPPLAPDPETDGAVWTAAASGSLGARNLAPPPALGSSLRLNEVFVDSSPLTDAIELYNPASGRRMSIAGWSVLAGDGELLSVPAAEIGPGQVFVFTLPPGVEIEATGLVYLFDAAAVRVDQLGTGEGRTWASGCIGRLPDGEGPAAGWNLSTSDLTRSPCSIGDLNCPPGGCATPRSQQSWGKLKLVYR